MSTLNEEYWSIVAEIKELNKQIRRMPFNGEVKTRLKDRVRDLQRQIEPVVEYVMNSEEMAFEAMELKKKIEHDEECLGELAEIYANRNVPDNDLETRLDKVEQKRRIAELLYRMSNKYQYTRAEYERMDESITSLGI